MNYNEYAKVCDTIIKETMKFVDIVSFRQYSQLPSPGTDDFVYNNAVCDPAGISVIYTPSGTGKSSIIADRINALLKQGVPGSKILVLNMNVAKTGQMQSQFPDVTCLTFNNFTHGLFSANYPGIQATDTMSVINTLTLYPDNKIAAKLADNLKINNPQDRAIMTTLFINNHVKDVLDCILSIRKSTHTLESILCQNLIYALPVDPFDVETVLVNGVHNMSIPVFCSVLQYCSKHRCNLFITGDPEESIYDFSMAYNNAMNLLTAYDNVNIIRLQNRSKMTPSLKAVVERAPVDALKDVFVKIIRKDDTENAIASAFANNAYISDKIAAHEQVMIIARSKQDLSDIKNCIKTHYPGIKLTDITTSNPEKLYYANMAIKYLPVLEQKYTAITGEQLFYEIYNAFSAEHADSISLSDAYAANRKNAKAFFETHKNAFGNDPIPVETAIRALIDIEANIASDYLADLEANGSIGISDADIILSTIHASIDIRCDHVAIFIRNKTRFPDNPLYRVALTRANRSEYVAIVNEQRGIISDYEKYLTQYAIVL